MKSQNKGGLSMSDLKTQLFPNGKPTPEELIEAIVRYILETEQKNNSPAD